MVSVVGGLVGAAVPLRLGTTPGLGSGTVAWMRDGFVSRDDALLRREGLGAGVMEVLCQIDDAVIL